MQNTGRGYGGIMLNRGLYTRAGRRGLERVIFEIGPISWNFNLHKYHTRKFTGQLQHKESKCLLNLHYFSAKGFRKMR